MKIAIIRGENLNRYEMQSYQPLTQRHSLEGYAAKNHNYELDVGFPVHKLPTIKPYYGALRPILEGLLLPIGWDNRMLGLEEKLRSFDIIHAAETNNYYSLQSARAAKRYGKKLVLTCWENIPHVTHWKRLGGLTDNQHVIRYVKSVCSLYLAATERARTALVIEGVSEEKIRVVRPGIDLQRFKPDRQGHEGYNVLCVARLLWEKGLYDLLHAARLIHQDSELDDVSIQIVGAGPEKKDLTGLVAEYGLQDRVAFCGSYSYDHVPQLYHQADTFILPSRPIRGWQEQYGMVLLEAMASGVPIITTRSGSIPEVVGDSAMLIQPGDPLSIYTAIKKMHDNPMIRASLGASGRRRAEREYNCNDTAYKIEKMYEMII